MQQKKEIVVNKTSRGLLESDRRETPRRHREANLGLWITQITNSERAFSLMVISKSLLLLPESSTNTTCNMVSQMMILTLWSHFGPTVVHGFRDGQTDSSSYLCNSVIFTIYSTWILWVWHFSAASSCKLLENLIWFSLITSSIQMCFLPHIIFTMYFASSHFVFSY
jgi:hypothetical protein